MGSRSTENEESASNESAIFVSINFVRTADQLQSQTERFWQLDCVPSKHEKHISMSKKD